MAITMYHVVGQLHTCTTQLYMKYMPLATVTEHEGHVLLVHQNLLGYLLVLPR